MLAFFLILPDYRLTNYDYVKLCDQNVYRKEYVQSIHPQIHDQIYIGTLSIQIENLRHFSNLHIACAIIKGQFRDSDWLLIL